MKQTDAGDSVDLPLATPRRERPRPQSTIPPYLLAISFSGFLDDIYATLVVAPSSHQPLRNEKNFGNGAADFENKRQKKLGIQLSRKGRWRRRNYSSTSDPDLSTDTQMIFSRYVQEHLF